MVTHTYIATTLEAKIIRIVVGWCMSLIPATGRHRYEDHSQRTKHKTPYLKITKAKEGLGYVSSVRV
jgi:hypothetical protein